MTYLPTVYGGGGHPDVEVELSVVDLLRRSGAEVVDVAVRQEPRGPCQQTLALVAGTEDSSSGSSSGEEEGVVTVAGGLAGAVEEKFVTAASNFSGTGAGGGLLVAGPPAAGASGAARMAGHVPGPARGGFVSLVGVVASKRR